MWSDKSVDICSDVCVQVFEGDQLDANWRPPKGYDGTPNESAADVLTRIRQVMSVTETQYSGEDIVFIAPDSDTLSVLQVSLVWDCAPCSVQDQVELQWPAAGTTTSSQPHFAVSQRQQLQQRIS